MSTHTVRSEARPGSDTAVSTVRHTVPSLSWVDSVFSRRKRMSSSGFSCRMTFTV
ncbi:hypothetical protein ABH917_002882 [Thermobifida halotolerans]|uniref:hypothetical protein n=1 Tax=Thermobifida halotolerans TaxID=483545 RepID=UPI0035132E41